MSVIQHVTVDHQGNLTLFDTNGNSTFVDISETIKRHLREEEDRKKLEEVVSEVRLDDLQRFRCASSYDKCGSGVPLKLLRDWIEAGRPDTWPPF